MPKQSVKIIDLVLHIYIFFVKEVSILISKNHCVGVK